MNTSLITLRDVAAGYDGRDVVSGISLDVQRADFVGVTGPNGGGKTTLIKILVGLLTPTRGTVERRTQKIGYLPQQNLFDRKFPITVDEVVLSGLQGRAERLSKKDLDKVHNLLSITEITDLARRPIGELSGGQMQRVLLCRALIGEPELLVLDEPATFIDRKFEQEMYEILRKLNETMAIVMVSHDSAAIGAIAKRVIEVGGI